MNLFLECGVFLFLKEIPPDLVYDIDRDCANAFIKFLLEKQKWPEVLLLLTRKVSGEPPSGDCLIKDCDLSNLSLCAILPRLSAWDQRRTLLLGHLIDHGGESQMLSQHREDIPGESRCHSSWGFSLDFRDSFKFCLILFLLPIFSLETVIGSMHFCEFFPFSRVRNLRPVEGAWALV